MGFVYPTFIMNDVFIDGFKGSNKDYRGTQSQLFNSHCIRRETCVQNMMMIMMMMMMMMGGEQRKRLSKSDSGGI